MTAAWPVKSVLVVGGSWWVPALVPARDGECEAYRGNELEAPPGS